MIRQLIFSGWNFMRWLRLIFALTFITAGIMQHDTMIGLFGAFFLYQAVFNVGCCGNSACGIPEATSDNAERTKFINIDKPITK